MVVTVLVKGSRSGVPASWMMAAEAATKPDVPAVRMVMRARRCQLAAVLVLVWVQGSLRVKSHAVFESVTLLVTRVRVRHAEDITKLRQKRAGC
jgi:hypothetical protein